MMKKVFSGNSEVCHVFAQRSQIEGTTQNGNLYFYNDRIYSYGQHYILAEFIDDNTILINNSGYSNSTAKHINLIIGATRQYKQIYFNDYDVSTVKSIIDYNLKKLARALKPEIYINNIIEKWNKFNNAYNVLNPLLKKGIKPAAFTNSLIPEILDKRKGFYPNYKAIVNNLNTEDYKEKLKKAAKKEEAKKKAKYKKELAEKLIKFNSYEIDLIYTNYDKKEDYLRISKDLTKVETSGGANVPIKEAITLYKLIQSKKDIKGFKIGYYTVISINGTLKIGCHNININSMHNVGRKLLEL